MIECFEICVGKSIIKDRMLWNSCNRLMLENWNASRFVQINGWLMECFEIYAMKSMIE